MSAPESTPHSATADQNARLACFPTGWWIAAGICGMIAAAGEAWRWSDPDRRLVAWFVSLCGEQPDWLPFVPWLLLLPVVWWRRPHENPAPDRDQKAQTKPGSIRVAWFCCGAVVAAAFLLSRFVAGGFTDAAGTPDPPAYHDEYSYRFQAETFLAGRTWFPSFEPRPELFDQLHVLNLGRFASRYFPGTGIWLAPFVALGDPWLGQAIAHACCAGLLFWIGRELRDNVCGLTAGLLFALSPGLAIFSTLLLAHHPTLLGLLTFLWAFLRLMRRPGYGSAFAAGTGLAYAMLCRPMTAAGFALPFGFWTVWFLFRGGRGQTGPDLSLRGRIGIASAIGAPLVAGLLVMLWYSWTITGDPLTSPYQLYTDVYTPRHVYGFNNVQRGEQRLGPRVVDNYDRWAENLTPRLAARNTWRRFVASLRMTLAAIPLLFAAVLLLFDARSPRRWGLIALAIVSLFAVHVPYWFSGIMEWHYVLEASPLWLLLVGSSTSSIALTCRRAGWFSPLAWWIGVLGTAVAVNWMPVPLSSDAELTWWLWRGRVQQLAGEISFARSRYSAVSAEVDRLRAGQPAVLLVIPDPADRSLDYVTNSPSLSGPVLRARLPVERTTDTAIQEAAELFPGRVAVIYDARASRMEVLSARGHRQ